MKIFLFSLVYLCKFRLQLGSWSLTALAGAHKTISPHRKIVMILTSRGEKFRL